jgi:sugar/nucleoside kinase (ribokinase family)
VSRLAAEQKDKVFWADSRLRCELFRNVIVKPNEREASEACLRSFGRVDFAGLRRVIGSRPLIVTRGGEGAEVWDENGVHRVPSRPVANPVDICGAGDSFSAAAALALAVTGSAVEAARLGNLAAGVTIGKKGTGTASPEEMLAAEE